MSDDLNFPAGPRHTVAMLKAEPVCLPCVYHGECGPEMAIVISSEEDRLTPILQAGDEILRCLRGGVIVREVAEK